ncbi:hypothetical protein Tco_1355702, partial [Tanacetum coccineum]
SDAVRRQSCLFSLLSQTRSELERSYSVRGAQGFYEEEDDAKGEKEGQYAREYVRKG